MSDADRYRLAPVRDTRARDERVRQGDLATAVGDERERERRVEAAQAGVDRARAGLDAARTALQAALVQGTNAHELVRRERYLARARHALTAAIDVHARACADHRGALATVDLARERLVRARAEREVIERHFARWRAEQRKLAERRDD